MLWTSSLSKRNESSKIETVTDKKINPYNQNHTIDMEKIKFISWVTAATAAWAMVAARTMGTTMAMGTAMATLNNNMGKWSKILKKF